MKWRIFIKDNPSTYPEKDSLCLCFDSYTKEYVILQWNIYYKCWDDPDDIYQHSDYIVKYEYMSNITDTLDMNSKDEKREA